jgi:hypothetical protein
LQRKADEVADKPKQDDEVAVAPSPRSLTIPGNDVTCYLGVAPEYMNYADPTHKPYMTEEEALLYTDLSNDDIRRTRERDYPGGYEPPKNERPAVAEDTAGAYAHMLQDQPDEDEDDEADGDAEDDKTKNDNEPHAESPPDKGKSKAKAQSTGLQPPKA